jgi:uncharacterized protein YdaU (DUF1376 family)
MNYYPFHIGDYASATRHLSWDEDAAYRRLLDTYYTTEKPLPLEMRQIYRLVVATTDAQREAVRVVLEEFFEKTDEGWVNRRAETEILSMREKQEKQRERVNKRWEKYRESQRSAPGDTEVYTADSHENVIGNTAVQKPDTAVSEKRTDVIPPTPTPTPIPIKTPHTPCSPKGGRTVARKPASARVGDSGHDPGKSDPDPERPPDDPPPKPTQTGEICVAVRAEGVPDANPQHPKLLALIAAGAEIGEFVDAARAARARGKNFAYLLGIVEGRRRDAAEIAANARASPPRSRPMTASEGRALAAGTSLAEFNAAMANEYDERRMEDGIVIEGECSETPL